MIKEEGKVRAMKRGIGAYISAILIILNGVICIVNHQEIYKWIPSLCGAILLIKGIIMLIEGIRAKDYATLEGKKFEIEEKENRKGLTSNQRQTLELYN